MRNDRWRARAKGGRRPFLWALFGFLTWIAAGLRDVLLDRAWNALTARREQRGIIGTANITLGPLTVSASGTMSNPPGPGDPSSHIA
jgi:hypothetical protein